VKVGIFDPYLDDLGGGEKYMVKIAQCLARDNEVFLFWDSPKDIERLKNRFLLDFSGVKLTKNIFSPSTSTLTRLLESRKFDSIIVLSDGSIPFLLSKKTYVHFQQPFTNIKKDFRLRFKTGRVKKFFCNSLFTKSYIDETYGVNSSVLYPPIDLKPKKIKKENIILHVGRFRVKGIRTSLNQPIGDYKKQSLMIEVFKKMINEGLKNWKFVLAVSINDSEKHLFEKTIENSKGFPIEFLINKNNDELWEIYSKSKIYWHASGLGEDLTKNPQSAEHFGISTVEAMGAGVVPVVINAGGQKEIIQDSENGLLWNTEKELIEKTESLIKNEKTMEIMSKAAINRARFFAGNRFCNDLEKILQ